MSLWKSKPKDQAIKQLLVTRKMKNISQHCGGKLFLRQLVYYQLWRAYKIDWRQRILKREKQHVVIDNEKGKCMLENSIATSHIVYKKRCHSSAHSNVCSLWQLILPKTIINENRRNKLGKDQLLNRAIEEIGKIRLDLHLGKHRVVIME